ncbi:MAG TPA: GAF domain-containing protein [Kofleriaceae bacterium]|nr:GAF domain-containing protein [Kofleriaceae bacterium]
MEGLAWSTLAVPYFACSIAIASVAVCAALVRGDRVLRLGMIGASMTAMPWALCQGFAACTNDPTIATRLERLGNGPIELCGPCLLLVLLAASGQLERFRWVARISGLFGTLLLILVWATPWVVPGVQRLSSGMFYIAPGPLTAAHVSLLLVWLVIGVAIMRASSPQGERRRTLKLVIGILVLGAIASIDTLALYGIWGAYPIAWLSASCAAFIASYLVLRTDLVRPRGLDRGVAIELAVFAIGVAATALLALLYVESPAVLAGTASLVWAALTAVAWAINRRRPARMPGARSLDEFVANVATLDDPAPIADRLAALWQRTLKVPLRRSSVVSDGTLVDVRTREQRPLDRELAAWLVQHPQPFAVSDLATMRLGAMRARLEALGEAHPNALVVPLVDRDELVGLVEADRETALRDAERDLVAESARAAARALTFVGLARAAARERETAREVEIAEALRLQAAASREAELGGWAVAGEYRGAARTTGAGWSAVLLPDGRLALLVTEAQAPGVAAALATAALTGAFAAATLPATRDGEATPLAFDELVATMRASSEGVMRGGQPVAAFLAICDASAATIEWAAAGHPGAVLVGPLAGVDVGLPEGSRRSVAPTIVELGPGEAATPGQTLSEAARGVAPLPEDMLVVVASTGLRGDSERDWARTLREYAPASGRLAAVLVEQRARRAAIVDDLLAVVVRR